MLPSILEFVEHVKQRANVFTGRLLEVGSLNVNGSVRTVFTDAQEHIGVDIQTGAGVDIVLDAECLDERWDLNSFDTIACFECLEHCIRPWRVVGQMKLLLRPGGHLWVSTPSFGFPEHRYPVDCYRFGEDAYRLWLYADMDLIALSTVHDGLGHPVICAVGVKR